MLCIKEGLNKPSDGGAGTRAKSSVRRVETRVSTRAILAKLAEFRVELESQLEPTRVGAEFGHVHVL